MSAGSPSTFSLTSDSARRPNEHKVYVCLCLPLPRTLPGTRFSGAIAIRQSPFCVGVRVCVWVMNFGVAGSSSSRSKEGRFCAHTIMYSTSRGKLCSAHSSDLPSTLPPVPHPISLRFPVSHPFGFPGDHAVRKIDATCKAILQFIHAVKCYKTVCGIGSIIWCTGCV